MSVSNKEEFVDRVGNGQREGVGCWVVVVVGGTGRVRRFGWD